MPPRRLSVPALNAIYPVSIVLIMLGLSHRLWQNTRFVYPLAVGGTAVVSVIYAMDEAELPALLSRVLPLYGEGYGWLCAAAGMLIIGIVLERICPSGSK